MGPHRAVQEVEAKLGNRSGPPIHRAAPGTPQSQDDRNLGARTRQVPRLPRAPEPPVVLRPQGEDSLQNNSRHSRGRDTIQCDRCGHTTTSERRMENHIRNIHISPQLASKPLTLLVGDSHLGSVNQREVAKVLGRGSWLVTPGATRPREDRAYCSTPEWAGARYPNNSLQQMVP